MTILVLGPTKWRPGHLPEVPPWVEDFLPAAWSRRGTNVLQPIDVRAAMVGSLSRAKREATLMEAHPPEPGETHTALYRRVVRSQAVRTYFVY